MAIATAVIINRTAKLQFCQSDGFCGTSILGELIRQHIYGWRPMIHLSYNVFTVSTFHLCSVSAMSVANRKFSNDPPRAVIRSLQVNFFKLSERYDLGRAFKHLKIALTLNAVI